MCSSTDNFNAFHNYLSFWGKFQGHSGISSCPSEDEGVLCGDLCCYSKEIKMQAESMMLHHALPDDLLAKGEGERVCCCSDLVLCLHVGHILCVSVTNGHHPVSNTDSSLSCLSARRQLKERENTKRRLEEKHVSCDNREGENKRILRKTSQLMITLSHKMQCLTLQYPFYFHKIHTPSHKGSKH